MLKVHSDGWYLKNITVLCYYQTLLNSFKNISSDKSSYILSLGTFKNPKNLILNKCIEKGVSILRKCIPYKIVVLNLSSMEAKALIELSSSYNDTFN